MKKPFESRLDRSLRYGWLIVWCLVCFFAVLRVTPGMIETDIKALLPQDKLVRQASDILANISDKNAKTIWVLIESPSWHKTRKAAETFVEALPSDIQRSAKTEQSLESIRALYRRFIPNFLTEQDARWLKEADPQAVGQRALQRLYQPVSFSVFDWTDDPLGLFQNWLLSHNAFSRFTQRDGFTVLLDNDAKSTIVLSLTTGAGLAANASGTLTDGIAAASARSRSVCSECTVFSSGIPLIAEAVSSRAAFETSTIGLVALAGIVFLTWLFFRRFAPIGYLIFVLGTSTAFAFCSLVLIFDRLHVLTFVFGATLLGICVDYVFHAACALLNGAIGIDVRRKLLRPLGLSLLSTILGYALMLAVPVPGLRQMALFCINGLAAAFVTLMLTLPLAPQTQTSVAFVRSFCELLSRWIRPLTPKQRRILIIASSIVTIGGVLQLQTTNELNLLNSIPKSMLETQATLNQRLSDTSPSQFFLVQAPDDQTTLDRLASLHDRLESAVRQGIIRQAFSPYDWLPDYRRQQENARLTAAANASALAYVERHLKIALQRPTQDTPLANPSDLTALPPFGSLWLDGSNKGAVVLLSGVGPDSLGALQNIADSLDGVSFINLTADIATSLGSYRTILLWIVGLSLVMTLWLLRRLYRKDVIHVCLPCLLSLLMTLGILGWCGIPVSLFSTLPLLLLLGLSVDYALLMHSEQEHSTVWASIFLAGSSTLLSFGLLSLSSTPALSHFGMTVLIGIALAWLLTPLLRAQPTKER